MKKIIAREFLFVLGYAVLVGLIYCTLLLMKYTNQLKVEELSRQAIVLKDFQPYKYYHSFSEGDSSVYDDFKELYVDLRSYGITDIDESEFDIFAKFNCSAYGRNNKSMDEKILKIIELMEAAGESEQSIVDVVSVYKKKNKSSEVKKYMNEELLKLVYSKLNTDASFEEFKSDFQSNEDLQRLSYSKLDTDASFEDFKSDAIGQVKKEDDSKVTSQEEGTALLTSQQKEESTSTESFTQHSDMDENAIKGLFNVIPRGMFTNEEELKDLIESEGVGVIYSAIPKGMFSSKEEFESTFSSAIITRISTFQYNQLSNFYTSAKIKLKNEINRVRRKNPFEYFGILVLSLFSLVFLLRYLVYSIMWSVKQLKN